jgi:endogenous inhibitor of DNA gyrase (YacG/DUF329 family)
VARRRDDDTDTDPCPYCRRPVYHDAEQCPHCGQYISAEDAPAHRPLWVLAGVVVCLVLVALWVLGR